MINFKKLIENIFFSMGYVKILRPTATEAIAESMRKDVQLKEVTILGEFPTDVLQSRIFSALAPRLGAAMSSYVKQKYIVNKETKTLEVTWHISFIPNDK